MSAAKCKRRKKEACFGVGVCGWSGQLCRRGGGRQATAAVAGQSRSMTAAIVSIRPFQSHQKSFPATSRHLQAPQRRGAASGEGWDESSASFSTCCAVAACMLKCCAVFEASATCHCLQNIPNRHLKAPTYSYTNPAAAVTSIKHTLAAPTAELARLCARTTSLARWCASSRACPTRVLRVCEFQLLYET